MWYVYILKNSESNKYYVGCTSDIKRRIAEHQLKSYKRWATRQAGSWQIAWQKEFVDKTDALCYERGIKKKKSRIYIERLIAEQKISGSSISLA